MAKFKMSVHCQKCGNTFEGVGTAICPYCGTPSGRAPWIEPPTPSKVSIPEACLAEDDLVDLVEFIEEYMQHRLGMKFSFFIMVWDKKHHSGGTNAEITDALAQMHKFIALNKKLEN